MEANSSTLRGEVAVSVVGLALFSRLPDLETSTPPIVILRRLAFGAVQSELEADCLLASGGPASTAKEALHYTVGGRCKDVYYLRKFLLPFQAEWLNAMPCVILMALCF
jgi:hypothetical protein